MKIVLFAKDSCLRASARHGGQGEFSSSIRRGGVPQGVAECILSDGGSNNNPRILSEYHCFLRKCSLPRSTFNRVFSPRCAHLKFDTRSKRHCIIIALSAGAVRGDRNCPLPPRTRGVYFISEFSCAVFSFWLMCIPCIHLHPAVASRALDGNRFACPLQAGKP